MAKIYKTSRGEAVDMDMLRLANEKTIALGNMKVNARGDELGKGGKIVRTRSQIMSEYHKLNTPMIDDYVDPTEQVSVYEPQAKPRVSTPIPTDLVPVEPEASEPAVVKPRGSFAESIAKETEVNQELLDPAPLRNPGSQGVSRI